MKKIDPKISIIMPVYGVEKYLHSAIESVLKQNFSDWELLLILDGKIDRSDIIAKKYAKKDQRIKVYEKENGGLSDARNYGLERAKGNFVHFFDSDDEIESDFYFRMYSEISSQEKDLIICGYYVDTVTDDIVFKKEHCCFDCLEPNHSKFDLRFVGEYVNFAWNKLFKRDFLIRNQIFFEKGLWGYEDVEFMSRYMSFYPKIMFLSYKGYHYFSRKRKTLSYIFDYNVVNRSLGNLKCYKKLLFFFTSDPEEVEKCYGIAVLGVYKALFPLIFQNCVDKLKLTKWIINNKELLNEIPRKSDGIFLNQIFKFLIVHKFSFVIYLYYRFR